MLNNKRIFAIAALLANFICLSAYAAQTAQTVGDIIDHQAPHKSLYPSSNTNEGNEIPAISSMYGIGDKLTVKFAIRDGVVSVSEPGGQINNNWVFLRKGEGLSVFVQNISNKKTYRVTMKIPDDQEFGQKDKALSAPVEMVMPPMPQ